MVNKLWQQVPGLDELKQINYEYDLISGKTNRVVYQPGKSDQFIHRYTYCSVKFILMDYKIFVNQ